MQLGCSLPVGDIGAGAAVLRDYAQAAEGHGFTHLIAPDHVLGANPATDHGGARVGTTATAYHDPFVLFGFLAGCTKQIGFAVGVLILAQRQAVLVAKQAASLDVLVRRPVPARDRGRLERGRVHRPRTRISTIAANARPSRCGSCRRLWAEPHVRFAGEFHRIEDAGINPRPASGRVPIWYGGHAEATFRRCARYGDGFMPLAYPPGDAALARVRETAPAGPRSRPRPGGDRPRSVGFARRRRPG